MKKISIALKMNGGGKPSRRGFVHYAWGLYGGREPAGRIIIPKEDLPTPPPDKISVTIE